MITKIKEYIQFGDFNSRDEGWYLQKRDAPTPDEYEQAIYTYNIVKSAYDEKMANYNLSQRERATVIANLEAEITKLTNELNEGE